ncbi:hypothetical protein ACT8ZV_09565 [Nocardioides sp. MAHUQ-72]|uniref:hypothetical protein n=1 Tax=unclassified Nocardioides TaxID=2615069 RepID=UPI00361F3939
MGVAMSARARTCAVLLVGVLLTAGGLVWVRTVPPSFVASAQLIFVRAPQEFVSNPLSTGIGSLIDVAAVVERSINHRPGTRTVVSEDLTLADQGIREGTVIRLANDGTQWANDFSRPVLDIGVVSRTRSGARDRLDRAIALVSKTLDRLQGDLGVRLDNRVYARPAQASTPVLRVGGDPRRALVATLLLGAVLTVGGLQWSRRPRRGAPSPR